MKAIVTLELDIPDTGLSEDEIRDAIYENFITYAMTSHIRDQMKWMVEGSKENITPDMAMGCRQITTMHKTWAGIIDKATKDIEIKS